MSALSLCCIDVRVCTLRFHPERRAFRRGGRDMFRHPRQRMFVPLFPISCDGGLCCAHFDGKERLLVQTATSEDGRSMGCGMHLRRQEYKGVVERRTYGRENPISVSTITMCVSGEKDA